MGFLGVYAAIYDYQPQSEGELEIKEGELLYVLEKSADDDWWKAKKRAESDEEEEPVGLIPNNYVEEATPTHTAKALYDYSRQTDEEVSFPEDAHLDVYDTSDPDWTLVGVNGEFGFAPSNYIELEEETTTKVPSAPATPQIDPEEEPVAPPTPSSPINSGPAAALASVLGGHAAAAPAARSSLSSPPSTPGLPPRPQYTPDASEVEEPAPALPRRPDSQHVSSSPTSYPSPPEEELPSTLASPQHNRAAHRVEHENGIISPSGFRMYNVSEMVSAMGKRKKIPITLGINMATGLIMLSPEKSRDGASQEWPANQLTHYSMESKHVFMELVRPSKSLDLHAGSKETASEIVALLGELAGVARAAGLDEVVAAATGAPTQKKGHILYDFMAQGDDEVTVAVGDEVIILDDINSEEWWLVRRVKNGKEGVVPSSYVEATETISLASPSQTGLNAGRSIVEQNRLEEERLTRQALRADNKRKDNDTHNVEVGPGMTLPDRGSSLSPNKQSQRHKRDGKGDSKSSKPKPDPMKTRTWTDRSNTFKVEAQFIGLTDGKIHLHKVNGVKIAVPINKMSLEDIEFVEKLSGVSLDDEKPLSDIRRKNRHMNGQAGATIERPKEPEYDWFDFFLKAGVGPHQCERYSQNFNRDSMDESILPEITPETLRTLGLKEGDILRVMKFLDQKYGRSGAASKLRNVSFAEDGADGDVAGGLFTGPDGTLKNNTRKGRPTPSTQASDIVDPKAFEQSEGATKPAETKATPLTSAPPPEKAKSGFDDDAWEVKQPRQTAAAPVTTTPQSQPPPSATAAGQTSAPQTSSAPAQNPVLTGALAELSLLSPPLQPSPAPQPRQQTQPPPPMIEQPRHNPQPAQPLAAPQQPQPTGANPAFFSQLNPQQTAVPQQTFGQAPQFQAQQMGLPQQIPSRQRPQPPQNLNTSSLIAPPPRPLSAPQNFPQQNQFGPPPLQPQLTGIPQASPPQAPPGQSMNELNQQRFQQQYGQPQLQPQATGFAQQGQALGPYSNGIMPQQTGFGQQQQQQPQFLTGNQQGSPFADPRPSFSPLSTQQTGFGGFQQQQQTGINSVLPQALQPQQTGFQPLQLQPQQTSFQTPQLQPQQTGFQPQQTGFQAQQTGVNGFGNQSFGQPPPPVPPLPPMPTQQAAPLVPQKTGPAPPVRFGAPKSLVSQPTGRKANLAQATPQNPFGF